MGIDDQLRTISERVRSHSSSMITEEAVKTAVVLPFLSALGYDVFNPAEVIPEFTADAVGKKGERVDYAIQIDGAIRILVECKPITCVLEKQHLAQLYRYFSVTDAKFAILTNGRTFQFHTDLEAPNKLDDRPFLTFDLSELNANLMPELKKFAKDGFDVVGVLQSANRLKYTSALKRRISDLMEDPSDDFVRLVTADLRDGHFTAAVRDQFTPLVKSAFREIVRDMVQNRITSALETSNAEDPALEDLSTPEPEVVTTDEEKEGFMIVRAIAREVIPTKRIVMRDQKTYCGILIDNNNRKPLARLWFNRATKYLSLFDGEKEDRIKIETLDHIYEYTDRIRATAQRYADGT
ncbi:type I restriction endonuclease [Consotaella aegiceratis]|uniref:type I restriction endonuclease n=1 Tax=Consotaella aegiceratis TaxID=3097961 RepID=UPI002F4141D1